MKMVIYIKVEEALVAMKGMTSHLKSSNIILKVVFQLPLVSMET